MKKLIKAIVLIFVFIMLTGCVTSTTKMTITKDKKMTVSVYMLTDDKKNIDVSKELDVVSITNNGFTVDKVSQDGYSGLKISKSYENIDDKSSLQDVKITISDILRDGFDDSKYFKVQKSFFINTYTADFKYKLASEIYNYANKHEEIDTSKLHTYLDETKFKFVVELPYGQIQSNAGSVEGNTLTWNLNSSEDNNITFAFDVYNLLHIYIAAGAAIVVFLTIVIFIAVKISKKKKEKRRLAKEKAEKEAALKIQQEEEWKRVNNVPEVAKVDSNNMTANKSFEFAVEYSEGSNKKVVKNRKFVEVSTQEEVLDFDKNKPKESAPVPVETQPSQPAQVVQPQVETPQIVEPQIQEPVVDNVPQSKFLSNTPEPAQLELSEPKIEEPEIVEPPVQEQVVDNVPQSKFLSNNTGSADKIEFINDQLDLTDVSMVGAPKNDSPFDNEEDLDSFLPEIQASPAIVDPTLQEFGLAPSAPAAPSAPDAPAAPDVLAPPVAPTTPATPTTPTAPSVPAEDPTLKEFGDLFASITPQDQNQNQAPDNTNKFV